MSQARELVRRRVFRESLERCGRGVFVDRFYERFLASSPEVREKFAGTDFDRSVWTILRRLKAGSTLTYGELAAAAGRAKAARAAGAACGRNPLPLFVPCHRVTGAGGRLGGFSSGLAWKRLLLSAEGALP